MTKPARCLANRVVERMQRLHPVKPRPLSQSRFGLNSGPGHAVSHPDSAARDAWVMT